MYRLYFVLFRRQSGHLWERLLTIDRVLLVSCLFVILVSSSFGFEGSPCVQVLQILDHCLLFRMQKLIIS